MIQRLYAWLTPIRMNNLTVPRANRHCRKPVWMAGIGGPPDPTPAGWYPCDICDLCRASSRERRSVYYRG